MVLASYALRAKDLDDCTFLAAGANAATEVRRRAEAKWANILFECELSIDELWLKPSDDESCGWWHHLVPSSSTAIVHTLLPRNIPKCVNWLRVSKYLLVFHILALSVKERDWQVWESWPVTYWRRREEYPHFFFIYLFFDLLGIYAYASLLHFHEGRVRIFVFSFLNLEFTNKNFTSVYRGRTYSTVHNVRATVHLLNYARAYFDSKYW